MCGCCVSECNSMEADPDFLGPAALAKAHASSATCVTASATSGCGPQRRARHLGLHALLLLQRALPEGRRSARRDRQARRRGLLRRHHVRRGRAARPGVRHLHPSGLPQGDRARAVHRPAEGAGRPVRAPAGARRQGPEPALSRTGPRTSTRCASCSSSWSRTGEDPAGRQRAGVSSDRGGDEVELRVLPRLPGQPVGEGARHLDPRRRRAARASQLVDIPGFTCCGAGDIHEARPEYYLHLNARILGQAEQLEQDTILTICNVCTLNLRQANNKLQADPELLERVNENLAEVGAASYAAASRCGTCCGRSPRATATSSSRRSPTSRSPACASRRSTAARSCARQSCWASRIPTGRSRWSGSSWPAAPSRWTTRPRSSAAASRSCWPARRWRWAS